jgi:hypothetical protein
MSIHSRTSRGMTGAVIAMLSAFALALVATPAGAAESLLDRQVTASGTHGSPCTDAPSTGAGVWTKRFTAPALGELTATLSGGSGDWDLAVFSAGSGDTVAGSAYSGSDEVAGGYAFENEPLIVQACARPGATGSPHLSVALEPILRDHAGPPPSLLRVQTPTSEERDALAAAPLDVTESAGPGYTDVIAYGTRDREVLARLGLQYTTEDKDLTDVTAAERRSEAPETKAAESRPGFPSGRTGTYRRLFDYSEEMKDLAAKYPNLVKVFSLPMKTYEGRVVQGIQITKGVKHANDGKPIFMQLGVHHAREWPSSEHAFEWAYEIIDGYKAGEPRATRLIKKERTIVVPIVNPDGFNASREAGELEGAAGGRGGNDTQETVNIVSHPNEYRRKNCRFIDDSKGGSCTQPSEGLAEPGVDPNRNYGGFWGGPGASTDPTAQDYRGPGPFSEPETLNIRSLISRKQVTAFITNHTFTGLVLRPPGIASQGPPVDEKAYKKLGAQMAAENGYLNQPSYGLYDTTGSTEDWAYYATGSFGYTFEIGATNFHPPYADTVAEWNGTSEMAKGGGGNRAAYYHIAEFALSKKSHAVIKGKGPKHGRIILKKSFMTSTSPVIDANGTPGKVRKFRDKLRTNVRVKRNGHFRYAINPSTRPVVAQSSGRKSTGPPSDPLHFAGTPADATPCADSETEDPGCWIDVPITIPDDPGRDNDSAEVRIEWNTPASDWDMKVFRDTDGDGSSEGEKNPVGTSASGPSTSEQVTIGNLKPGAKYVVRVLDFAGIEPFDGTVTFEGPQPRIKAHKERWTLVCKNRKGRRTGTRHLYIERGQVKALDLRKGC